MNNGKSIPFEPGFFKDDSEEHHPGHVFLISKKTVRDGLARWVRIVAHE
jgi:hypothetical protein